MGVFEGWIGCCLMEGDGFVFGIGYFEVDYIFVWYWSFYMYVIYC